MVPAVGGRAGCSDAALARAPRMRAAARGRRALAARREEGEFGLSGEEKEKARAASVVRYTSTRNENPTYERLS